MAHGDRERWDEKFRAVPDDVRRDPDPFAMRALERVPFVAGDRALDLACGMGRHAFELARRGWRVCAWDVSPVALASVRSRASQLSLVIETRELDLSELAFERSGERFHLVVCVNFLDRELFARFADLLHPGGHLVYATFTVDRPGERPALAHCLGRGELASGLPGIATLWQEESAGRAGLLGRRAAEPTASGS